MSTIDTKFHQRLVKRIEEESRKVMDAIGNGTPATWDQYQKQVGVLRGYQNVLAMSQEIEREIENG